MGAQGRRSLNRIAGGVSRMSSSTRSSFSATLNSRDAHEPEASLCIEPAGRQTGAHAVDAARETRERGLGSNGRLTAHGIEHATGDRADEQPHLPPSAGISGQRLDVGDEERRRREGEVATAKVRS
jgi:hypothetical protein